MKFSAICPKDRSKTYPMWIDIITVDGKPFPLPCAGCDNRTGEEICSQCTAWITGRFLRDQHLEVGEVLRPLPEQPL